MKIEKQIFDELDAAMHPKCNNDKYLFCDKDNKQYGIKATCGNRYRWLPKEDIEKIKDMLKSLEEFKEG